MRVSKPATSTHLRLLEEETETDVLRRTIEGPTLPALDPARCAERSGGLDRSYAP
jgi:hypothetical protein